MESESKRSNDLEIGVIDKVGEVIGDISSAKQVDDVIVALQSISVLLFPTDTSLFSGSIDEHYREKILSITEPSENERNEWWQAFYRGSGFLTLARFLLLDVALNWLACFPYSAKRHVYDIFFNNGPAIEVVQTLCVYLQHKGNDSLDTNVVRSNVERLLVQCLLENHGVHQLAREFDCPIQYRDLNNSHHQSVVSRVAQIVASIPDKARPGSPNSLSSHSFFKQITVQLLRVRQWATYSLDAQAVSNTSDSVSSITFVGEMFSRICRRGSSDVLLGEIVPEILGHIRNFFSSNNNSSLVEVFGLDPQSLFWFKTMEAVKDPYAVEIICERLLYQLEIERATDSEGYWTLWILLDRVFKNRSSVRTLFLDKFLFWKIFPIRCLRWIIQFSVLRCPPINNSLTKGDETLALVETVQRLVAVWSKKDFVRSSTMEQQIYATAAIGLCMEMISKEELDKAKDVMHSILQGVSCRLESPDDLVRKMASNIALVFSKVIDPNNPLYLDDSCTGEIIDWEFGLTRRHQGTVVASDSAEKDISAINLEKDLHVVEQNGLGKTEKNVNQKSKFELIDPDEIVDPASLNCESPSHSDEDEVASEISDASSDSSLKPYDLTDDDTDLQRKLPHLVDVIGALRKSDDADGVEAALNVAEKLVRASPDELSHIAGELAQILVQVRCSDLAVEGEEESAENKRQRALVALLVTCPFQSLDALNRLLFSPTVDVSQRIMILDVMTEAAQELAVSKIVKPKEQPKVLVSTVSESQPWFFPSTKGPPGAGVWKEVSETGTPLNYSNRYERELPPRRGQITRGKTRRWSVRSENLHQNQLEYSQNKFPVYAAAFMLPAMQGFDKRRHGVDLLGEDFILLGKLIYMLGVCMRCISMHPEATVLAPSLMDMLRSREVCQHKEAYVRKAVLFAASCILLSLHPSYVASAVAEGNIEVAGGLEWIRSWAFSIAETDVDRECYTMAMSCLQIHAEMALQASRALEQEETSFKLKNLSLPSGPTGTTIKIPYSNTQL